MHEDTQSVRQYFEKLHLEPEIANLYLALNAHGPMTISELARRSGVERTRVYRLLDIMTDLHLCEAETEYKRSIVKPAPTDNLQLLIARREQELQDLQSELGDVEQILKVQQEISSPATRVQFYKGDAGLKQMLWNQTRAQTESVSILYETIQIRTRSVFFERWARKCNERNIQFRSVVGDKFLGSLSNWYSTHQNERLEHWKGRHLSDDTFQIRHSTIVYNDVTAYYNWKDGEVFGIEVYNQEIADSQRQLFELLWAQAAELSAEQAAPHMTERA